LKEKNTFAVVVGILSIVASVIVSAIVASRTARSTSERFLKECLGREGGGGIHQKTLDLKLAHSLPTTHPVHKGMVYMAKELEKISGGEMKITIFPNEQLGKETVIISKLQRGEIALGKTSAAAMEGFAPIMGVFSLPYIFKDSKHYWKVLDGKIGGEILDATLDKGLKGLCYYDAGARSFYCRSRMIESPADLAGLQVRVMKSPTACEMVKLMGGIPTPMSFGELYSALQSGRVDAAENNPPSFLSSKHCEVCKFYSLDEHARIPDILMVSKKVWDSLTGQQREWLLKAAKASSLFQRELWAKATKEDLEALVKNYGVKIARPDKKTFAKACQPMYDKLEGTEMGKIVARIKALGE